MKILCVLLAVLGPIVGVLFYATRPFGPPVYITLTRQDLAEFHTRLDQYKKLGGTYPTTEQGLQALVDRPTTEPFPNDWIQSIPEVPLDPWRNPYRYQLPGTKDPPQPEIISAGPDGLFDTEDDFTSQDDIERNDQTLNSSQSVRSNKALPSIEKGE